MSSVKSRDKQICQAQTVKTTPKKIKNGTVNSTDAQMCPQKKTKKSRFMAGCQSATIILQC